MAEELETAQIPPHIMAAMRERMKMAQRMSRIKHKIVVMSGKGGVGKATVAANLACVLAEGNGGTCRRGGDRTGHRETHGGRGRAGEGDGYGPRADDRPRWRARDLDGPNDRPRHRRGLAGTVEDQGPQTDALRRGMGRPRLPRH